MKVAHESPNSIFKEVQKLTDYDYCLAHLYMESRQYRSHFRESVRNGREVILDNSIFEGKPLSNEGYAEIIKELMPEWYIVPDVLERYERTIANYVDFTTQYPNLPGKRIGVVQGKTMDEIVKCYTGLLKLPIDKIAISFDYSYYTKLSRTPDLKLESWCTGRQTLLDILEGLDIIDTSVPHHLLGCSLAKEFSYYKNYKWIDSVDTSNPVVAGYYKMKYEGTNGLSDKPSMKLMDLIDVELSEEQKEIIFYNIKQFKQICG